MQPGPYGAPPPPAAPTAPTTLEPLRPSGWWYAIGAAVAIGGIALSVVVGVRSATSYTDRIDDFDRVDVPGSETFALDAGSYTIYHEYFDANDEFSVAPNVSVNVTGPGGDAVELDDYSGEFNYAGSGHEGEARFTFEAEESGDYTVSAEGDGFSTIAVGEGVGMQLFVGIAVALVLGFVGVVVCAVICIVVAVKRSGAKTRRQLALVRSGWRPPGSPGGWPQGPGQYGGPPGYSPPPGYTPPGYYPPPQPPQPPAPPASPPPPA